jgi:hypothetical protein
MKGFIDKGEGGWFVCYVALSKHDVGTIIKELPLHPETIQEFKELSKSIDNLDAPCLSLVLLFNICDEKQKEFSQHTFKNLLIYMLLQI